MRFRVVIVLLLCAGALTACDRGEAPILRGTRLPEPPAPVAPAVSPVADAPAKTQPPLEEAVPSTPIILNLTLPDYEWDELQPMERATLIPDVFHHPSTESRLNWSGRLHLDESDEATERPLQESILGAEVELQLRLP